MQVQSVARVIERMERAMGGVARPVVTSDADGTLWQGDVGQDAFDALVKGRGLREACREPLVAQAEAAGLATHGDANALARRIQQAFARRAFEEDRYYELQAWAFAGWTPDEVRSFATRVQQESKLASRLHSEMQAIVHWLQTRGVEFWIVSASPALVAQTGAAHFGVSPERVIATSAAVHEGQLAPCLAAPMPYGAGKVEAIEREVRTSSLIAAFGDNVFDLEMLSSAEIPVAVRPSDRLRNRAADEPRMVELGRE